MSSSIGDLPLRIRRRLRRLVNSAAKAVVSEDKRINATTWDLFGTYLRSRSFAALAKAVRGWPRLDPLVAYYQPKYPALSETFIRREISALRAAGVQVHVFTLELGDQSLLDPAELAGVTQFGPEDPAAGRAWVGHVFRRDPSLVIALALWIVRCGHESWWRRDFHLMLQAGQLAFALHRAKVTHVHAPWANRDSIVAFVASRLIGATFTVQARASEIHRTISGRGIADRVRFAEFIITNSEYNQRYLKSILDRDAPPVHVVRNGLDCTRFLAPDRGEKAGESFRLLAVGRLVEPKGFTYLLEACRMLRDRGHDVECDIVGGRVDPMDTVTWIELQLLHDSSGLGDHVRFTGPQSFEQVLARLRAADAFVLPCVRARDGSHDITPNSLIEAMAMQLPVISTTSGAIPEIVEHEISGLLVPPADAESLADAIERVMLDASLRVRLGQAARARVEERFDAHRNARNRIALLQSLLSKRS